VTQVVNAEQDVLADFMRAHEPNAAPKA